MTISEVDHGLPRRTIRELVARYELEPGLRDLFVEGLMDRRIYGWYLNQVASKRVTVFEIDSIEIPSDVLLSHGLGSGNRARIIALALELDGGLTSVLPTVRCIADSDFDFIFRFRIEAEHLLYTDYTSVDLYTYEEDLLKKALWLGFNVPQAVIAPLVESISSVLEDVFIVRAANQKLDWGMRLIPFTRCCAIEGLSVTFDKNDFIDRCLDSNSRRNERIVFEEFCEELQAVYLDDHRQRIRGDDYFELIGWYLKERWDWSGYRNERRSIMPNLIAALDDRLLSNENLFVQLSAVFQ